MNTTDFNGKQYTMQDNGDGSITLVPVVEKPNEGDWVPKEGETHWYVGVMGGVYIGIGASVVQQSLGFHNIFSTDDQAAKAAEYMRRSNAVIRACLLVDPDFVPDWRDRNQYKYFPFYSNSAREWGVDVCYEVDSRPAYVSSGRKCEQVCALLTKWGVK